MRLRKTVNMESWIGNEVVRKMGGVRRGKRIESKSFKRQKYNY